MNPLPFQDLQPKRFEDLVRQLAYEFREWHSLEAIGRSGSDGGTDIRGSEVIRLDTRGDANSEVDTEVEPRTTRRWTFQCKRERTFGPRDVEAAVEEGIPSGDASPHGFVLAVACDVSRKARDKFRELMVSRGVGEFFIWARGELEDRLFQPENDRLLFAYFGISLTTRRRSSATSIRSAVAIKRQVLGLAEHEDREEMECIGRMKTGDGRRVAVSPIAESPSNGSSTLPQRTPWPREHRNERSRGQGTEG